MTISRSKNGPTRYKVEVGGWSLTVYRSSLLRALEAVVVILASFLLFHMGQAQALHERGREAIGGEYLLLGLPVLYYLLRAVLKDYLADLREKREQKRREHETSIIKLPDGHLYVFPKASAERNGRADV